MNEFSWAEKFTPAEREGASDIVKVAYSLDWIVIAGSGLSAISLFILSANRSRQGDTLGSALSAIAGIICAIAPILAKNLFNGGI